MTILGAKSPKRYLIPPDHARWYENYGKLIRDGHFRCEKSKKGFLITLIMQDAIETLQKFNTRWPFQVQKVWKVFDNPDHARLYLNITEMVLLNGHFRWEKSISFRDIPWSCKMIWNITERFYEMAISGAKSIKGFLLYPDHARC